MGDVRVLSIQSHVVYGYVGNKSAVFPLQLLGFEVDFINSVQFSNHTAYPSFKGHVMDGAELDTVIQGMEENKLINQEYLLTGYIGSASFCRRVLSVYDRMIKSNPNLIYVCDPVLGDNGEFYVPPELVEIYKEEVIPRATVLTPNQFEAEKLTGMPITNEQQALAAIDFFHGKGVRTVVLTSCVLGDNAEQMVCFASASKDGGFSRYKITFPKIPHVFTGSGDLTSALLLAWTHHHPDNLSLALHKTISTMQAVLELTVERGGGELKLIQSKSLLENPPLHKVSVPCPL